MPGYKKGAQRSDFMGFLFGFVGPLLGIILVARAII